ncbi:MAG TPA: MFS transporter [Humibacter sp.]|nr:MFS transporter [Humibacter sp.]
MTNPPGGILGSRYIWSTVGTFSLVFLAAFENLAVTTVMPLISALLDGSSLYALAFAGPLAVGIVGMVVGGNWSDRNGPKPTLYASVLLFVIGLLIAGTAPSMWMLVIGRLVAGLGGGAVTVALYVIVARVYPARLQPAIFGAFAAAWVVPSLVGPFVAGVVAQYTSWHWVFLGVVALVVPAVVMVWPAMRGLPRVRAAEPVGESVRERPAWSAARIAWSVLAALAVLGIDLSADAGGWVRWVGAAVAVAVALIALRPLMPAGTMRVAKGLPGVIVTRGMLAGAYFGAEVYVPYLLTSEYRLAPSQAGLALTAAGVAWAASSWLQGRAGETLTHRASARLGVAIVSVALLALLSATAFGWPTWTVIAVWTVGGAGMGLAYPRLSVLTLAASTPLNQGFNSSAMSIADSAGAATAIAGTGIVFAALAPLGPLASFSGCFVLSIVFSFGAAAASSRISARDASGDALARDGMSDGPGTMSEAGGTMQA